MKELIQSWDGESVITRYDTESSTWMFIAIHSTTLGVATGGTRMKKYPSPEEALMDAMRLAEGMTYKWAGINFPRGGAKAVLAVEDDLSASDREGLLTRYGKWLSNLQGIVETGPDLGTSPNDMDLISQHYSGIFGCTESAGGQGDPGPYTALGVFSGIRASCELVFGSDDLKDRCVVVQGVGSVGDPLIKYLLQAGCEVRFSEVNPERIASIKERYKVAYVDPENVYAEHCDVFAPCATGGILNAKTIPLLNCSIVAGGANNQLEKPDDAARLKECGILYAPDYIINAGGALYLVSIESMVWTEEEARGGVLEIGDTLKEIYATSDERGMDTGQAAEALARDRIQLVSSN